MSAIDTTDKVFNIAKNFFALAAIGLAIWIYLPFFGVLRGQLKAKKDDLTLKEISFLYAKFEVANRKLELSDKLNTPERIQGKQDMPVSSTAKEAVQLIQAASQPSQQTGPQTGVTSWVYIGDLRKDGWHVKNFDVSAEPKVGQVITATNDVFSRAGKPVNTGGDNWKLGEIQGLINKGAKATIRSLDSIEGYGGGKLWWAEVGT